MNNVIEADFRYDDLYQRLVDHAVAYTARAVEDAYNAGLLAERIRIAGLLKLLAPETHGLIERACNDGRTADQIFQEAFKLLAARQHIETLGDLENSVKSLLTRMRARKPAN